MSGTWQYALAAIAIGAIGYLGSEALFWAYPPEGITLAAWASTVVAYALAGACALSAVIWSGLVGWRALFLGGAVMGFVVEGVIVATMYDAFPFQLVWTPLAWHALVTGLAVSGLHLSAMQTGWARHLLALLALGAAGGLLAGYWPMERPVLPSTREILVYQIGSGGVAVLGFVILGRMGSLRRPPAVVLALVPALAAVLWIIQGIADPRPQRLAFPLMLGATLWAMRRLGRAGNLPAFPQAGLARQSVFLLAPLLTALAAAFLWRGTGGHAANIVAALSLGPAGLALWLWLLLKAIAAGAAASADRHGQADGDHPQHPA
ncbi:hypothetical protein [Tabrizicola flagellatus]|uniref:hypothetical protein n=1 Tax=Tabrizicola flagellatus TaxID=2593021 RepID=UPI0011F31917|nr:hypothetical protein [Tabrizicola flagellatus]